ncbi:MAG: YsnF/AvaK domain-containing protein [Janthinobacterium lividum]
MASIVIGLFENRPDAESALKDLVDNNFDRNHIDLKESYSEDSQHSLASIRHELEGAGVPNTDAELFEEGMRAGDALEIVHTSDDQADLAREIMNRHGALDIHDASSMRGGSALGMAPAVAAASAAAPVMPGQIETADEIVVPIVQEELSVGKRQIQRGGVRVFQRVTERPVEETVTLRDETVTVDRRPVSRAVADADTAFAKTADFVITETDEVAVVSKQVHVVEEVTIGKTETDHTETIRDTVRRTDIDVEEIDGTQRS